jgi:hypothetical protein
MRTNEYFKIIDWLLKKRNVRILIFDENKIGKKLFYRDWLGEKCIHKFFFAEGQTIRDAISLMSSSQVKFIFGPSTGLLHCASGIYNVLETRETENFVKPIMIAYTGKIIIKQNLKLTELYDERRWWQHSLVDAIVLTKGNFSSKEIKYVREDHHLLSDTSAISVCKDYLAEDVISFVESNYHDRLSKLQLI